MIAAIIPDRGDRPKMLENCQRLLRDQDILTVFVVDPPKSELPDLAWRYKKGYDYICKHHEVELIFFIESDDWYDPEYIKKMYQAWKDHGRPDLFGIDYTYYYHLKLKKYFRYGHLGRASMMSTCIKPYLVFKWPVDHYRFVDMYLWDKLNGLTWTPEEPLCIGMKGHGEGKTGGTGHTDKLHRYIHEDEGFLETYLDAASLEFYSQWQ